MKRNILIVAAFLAAWMLRGVVSFNAAGANNGDVVKAILWDASTQTQAGTSTNPLQVTCN